MLYVLSTCYVVYLAFKSIDQAQIWNALLWIIILFASFNVVSRSFDQEREGRGLYLFTLASPQQVILSKMLYSMALMLSVAVLSFLVYSFFLPLNDAGEWKVYLFLIGIVLGSIGLATVLSLIAGIAWKTGNKGGMIAILGFPLILPLLYSCMTYCAKVLQGAEWAELWKYALAILSVDLIGLLLGFLLFPYIWRE
jgi:heme exporter protein B